MIMENYEDVILQCAQLLMRSHAVDTKENKDAVRIAAEALQFCGLEMKRLDVPGKTVIQSVCFMQSEQTDKERAMELIVEQEDEEPEAKSVETSSKRREIALRICSIIALLMVLFVFILSFYDL